MKTLLVIFLLACTSLNPSDGYKKGFIWKPIAEHNSRASGVLTRDCLNNVKSIWTAKTNGKTIDQLRIKSTGNCAGNPECLYRPAFESLKYSGATYRRKYHSIIVRVQKLQGGCIQWKLGNPSKRVD